MANHLLIESTRVTMDTWVNITISVVVALAGLFFTLLVFLVEGGCEAVVTAIIAVACVYGSIVDPISFKEDKSVPLSRISDQVHVTGSKVVIDELPDNIHYQPEHLKDSKDRKIFIFSYDETFETGKLTDATGKVYQISDEDTKFLKERGC